VTSTVIQGKTANELRISSSTVLHLHDFHHVQIGLGGFLVDGENSVDNGGRESLGKRGIELSCEGGSRNAEQQFSVDLLGQFEFIEELGD
jgi:hypothetical protein